jgi:hypothetical protein
MPSKSKHKPKRAKQRPESHYSLEEVRTLVNEENILIQENALILANQHFGWGVDDIISAILALKSSHFYKSEAASFDPYVTIDYYKARDLCGERVYTHFYIDERKTPMLVINSFKQL